MGGEEKMKTGREIGEREKQGIKGKEKKVHQGDERSTI